MSESCEREDFIVRLRGLPWSTENEDVVNFMDGCGIRSVNLMHSPEGRKTGEAYVELQTEEDFKQALRKHHHYIGSRYIDVIPATRGEMDYGMKKSGVPRGDVTFEDAVVKVRGLPFSCDKQALLEFFDGLPVTSNGVFLTLDSMGRASGEGFVQFTNQSYADVALKKHGQKIGHRYIEIFKSTLAEARTTIANAHRMGATPPRRPTPYDREFDFDRRRPDRFRRPYDDFEDRRGMRSFNGGGGGGGGAGGTSIHMRGLPFSASEADVIEFFYPINPLRVKMELNFEGRPSGNATVDFSNRYDAEQAMKRDRESMKHRYIELFYNNKASPGSDFSYRPY